MLVNRSNKNLASNLNKILPQQRVLFFALLSIACLSGTHAKPYPKDRFKNINWANYVAPSPLEMSAGAQQQYDGTNPDEYTDGLIEDTEVKRNELEVKTPRDDVPNSYEEQDGIGGNGNDLDEKENNDMGHASPMDNSSPPRRTSQKMFKTHKTSGKLSSRELERFLSQFYLIRTPYGYILGRVNPAISSSTISRRSSNPKPRMKSAYGSMMSPKFGTYVPPFGIRRPGWRTWG